MINSELEELNEQIEYLARLNYKNMKIDKLYWAVEEKIEVAKVEFSSFWNLSIGQNS